MPGRLAANSSNVSGPRSPLLKPFCFELVEAVLIVAADFLELGGDRAGIQHCAKVRLHGGEDFRPVRHDAEHVGHIAALGKCLVVKRCHIRGHFASVKPGNPGHRASLVFLPVSILTLYSAYRISLIATRDRRFCPPSCRGGRLEFPFCNSGSQSGKTLRKVDFSGAGCFDATLSLCYLGSGQFNAKTLLSSSMAEHSAVNRRVVGSSPT